MTILDVTQAPTVVTPVVATPSPVAGASTALNVLGGYNGGESNLTYSWTTTGTPPAAVVFSANGNNAAKNTVATFSKAGAYTLQVTIVDPAQVSVTSNVNVTVGQTLASATVALTSNNLATTGTEQFLATARDQFNNPLDSQPAFTWSVVGGGQIDASGNYMPPYVSGSATVRATSGAVTSTATAIFPGVAQWNSTLSNSWGTSGNWESTLTGADLAGPGLRSVTGDTVLLGSAVGTTVTLDGANPSLAAVTINCGASYTIAQGSGGAIHFDNGSNNATLTVSAGSHAMSAPVSLDSSVVVSVASGCTLTISGSISGMGTSLSQNGPGTLILTGTNNYTGDTAVSSGKLKALAIRGNGNTTVGPGAILQVNDIAQHQLTVAAGGVVVLGGVASGSGDSLPPTESSPAGSAALATDQVFVGSTPLPVSDSHTSASPATTNSVVVLPAVASTAVAGTVFAYTASNATDNGTVLPNQPSVGFAAAWANSSITVTADVLLAAPQISVGIDCVHAPSTSQNSRAVRALRGDSDIPAANGSSSSRTSALVKQMLYLARLLAVPKADIWRSNMSCAERGKATPAMPIVADNTALAVPPQDERLLAAALAFNRSTAAAINDSPATILVNRAQPRDAALQQDLFESSLHETTRLSNVLNAYGKQRLHSSLQSLASNTDSVFARYGGGQLDER
jgi:autotransporter-associated beta strand protein